MAYKHDLAVRVMAHIVNLAMRQPYVTPGDVPEDIVEKEHRQGVVSNAWGSLDSLEIIEKLSLNFTDDANGIVHGRKKNCNEGAKGRWTGAYRLRSLAAAQTWLARNSQPSTLNQPQPATPLVQTELI